MVSPHLAPGHQHQQCAGPAAVGYVSNTHGVMIRHHKLQTFCPVLHIVMGGALYSEAEKICAV